MVLSSHMGRQEQEKRTLWREVTNTMTNRKESSPEPSSTSSTPSMALQEFNFWSRSLCWNFTTSKS